MREEDMKEKAGWQSEIGCQRIMKWGLAVLSTVMKTGLVNACEIVNWSTSDPSFSAWLSPIVVPSAMKLNSKLSSIVLIQKNFHLLSATFHTIHSVSLVITQLTMSPNISPICKFSQDMSRVCCSLLVLILLKMLLPTTVHKIFTACMFKTNMDDQTSLGCFLP